MTISVDTSSQFHSFSSTVQYQPARKQLGLFVVLAKSCKERKGPYSEPVIVLYVCPSSLEHTNLIDFC